MRLFSISKFLESTIITLTKRAFSILLLFIRVSQDHAFLSCSSSHEEPNWAGSIFSKFDFLLALSRCPKYFLIPERRISRHRQWFHRVRLTDWKDHSEWREAYKKVYCLSPVWLWNFVDLHQGFGQDELGVLRPFSHSLPRFWGHIETPVTAETENNPEMQKTRKHSWKEGEKAWLQSRWNRWRKHRQPEWLPKHTIL